jgi:hypothetical protein
MTEADVFRRLNELSEADADGLRRLAEEIDMICREPARTVLTEWLGGPPARQIPCAFACSNLKELAVDEMLGRAESVSPALRVQLMDLVVTQQLSFRELMLTVLEPLLQDVTPAGITASGEELRTCDAAYLLVRKIVRLSAVDAEQFSNEDQFTALGEEQRDDEIDHWLRSETWTGIFPDPL